MSKINMFGENLIFQDMILRDIRGNFKLGEGFSRDLPAFRGLFRGPTAFEGFSRDSRDFRGQWPPCDVKTMVKPVKDVRDGMVKDGRGGEPRAE